MTDDPENVALPCPICHTDKYLCLGERKRQFGGQKWESTWNFYCSACGLTREGTGFRNLAVAHWNRLVKNILDAK